MSGQQGASKKWAVLAATVIVLSSCGVASGQAAAPAPGAGAASTSATPTVDQILEKYAQATGGRAAWQKLTSRVSKGTVEVSSMNLSGTIEMRQKAPNLILATVTVSGAAFSQGFDGKVAWSNDPQNGVRELTGDELAETRRDADFSRLLDMHKLYPKLSVTGKEVIGDRTAYEVDAMPEGSSEPDKIYFDAETGLALRSVTRHHMPDGTAEPFQEDYEDYREIDGVKMPFTIRQSTPEAEFTVRIDEMQHNVPLDDSIFAKPAVQ